MSRKDSALTSSFTNVADTTMIRLPIKYEIVAHEESKFRKILELDKILPQDLMKSLDMDDNKN